MRFPVGIFIILLAFIIPMSISAQSQDEPVRFASEMPVFPGGPNGMNDFIVKNIKYPKKAKKKGQTGKVYLQFVVEKDGTTSEHKVIRGINPSYGLDEEALRVVKLLTGFVPAKQNGKPVRLIYTIPISFTLS